MDFWKISADPRSYKCLARVTAIQNFQQVQKPKTSLPGQMQYTLRIMAFGLTNFAFTEKKTDMKSLLKLSACIC